MDRKGTPVHKFNIGGMVRLPRGFSISMNAGWKDSYVGSSILGSTQRVTDPYWRLDARLAYAYKDLELFAAGQNLTRPVHQLEFNGLETPRTFYGGLTVKFR